MVELKVDYDKVEFKDETFEQEVCTTVTAAVDDTFIPTLSYNFTKVGTWANAICERIVSDLLRLSMPRKYVCTCHFIQKNGAGVSTAISCYWDQQTDGSYTYTKENMSMMCICTVYGVAI